MGFWIHLKQFLTRHAEGLDVVYERKGEVEDSSKKYWTEQLGKRNCHILNPVST